MIKKLVLFSFLLSLFSFVYAQNQYFYTPPLLAPYLHDVPLINSRAAVLIDYATGALLYSKNPDEQIPPASLTKLMTMHLAMKEIEEGRASYDEIIPITEDSWAMRQPRGSSLMFLEPGQIVTLREIMLGLAVPSGNDAAVAAALRFAPSMEDFAFLMTMEARRMGLRVTRFAESSGISEFNMTTAAEFAYFCRQYIELHPQSLADFHSVQVFSYPVAANARSGNPQTIVQYNRNNLLSFFPGADGLKTGYIDESGYNFALTAQRDGTRFVSVTLGADTVRDRDSDGESLLSWAFGNFKTVRPQIAYIEHPRLWKGSADYVEPLLFSSADFTSPINRANELFYEAVFYEPLIAPIEAGTVIGHLSVFDARGELNRIALESARYYARGSFLKRTWHSIVLFFRNISLRAL